MKLVKFIETHRESLKILRENGIKRTDYAEYVDIYHDFKTLRAAPGSKFESVMVKSDQVGSSIVDGKHHALAIKDYIDDVDKADGYLFNRWLSDILGLGPHYLPYWEDMI